MSRPLRIDVEDGYYHVMSRGTERRTLFVTPKHSEHFLDLLEEMSRRYEVMVHAYVLMGHHYHLIIQTPHANASRAVQYLNTSFAAWFNAKHDRVGHVFQGRFKSVLIDGNGSWLLEASEYLHLNPVRVADMGLSKHSNKAEARGLQKPTRAALAQRLKKLREYRWSSYPAYAGYRRGPAWLQTEDLLQRAGGKKAYRRYVQGCVTRGEDPGVFDSLQERIAVGSTAFLERARGLAGDISAEKVGKHFSRAIIPFSAVVGVVEQAKGEEWKSFVNRHGDWGRDLVLYLAREKSGLRLAEIGAESGGIDSRAVGQAASRFKRKLQKDKALAKITRQCLSQLSNVKM